MPSGVYTRSEETRNKLRLLKLGKKRPNYRGDKNGRWMGDDAGIDALHDYVKKYKPKSDGCEKCGLIKPLDLHNISGKYLRDFDDWKYLCRSCHILTDGRNKRKRKTININIYMVVFKLY